MALLRIRLYPDPVLRVRCPEVTDFDDDLARLAEDMTQTMYAATGVGLAAPQVGVEKRIVIVDPTAGEEKDSSIVLVNPVVSAPQGAGSDLEGCLSIPGFNEKVDRPIEIHVEAQRLDGTAFEFDASDFLARVILHEVDHLDGVLFVDHLRGLRKEKAKRHLRRMREEASVA